MDDVVIQSAKSEDWEIIQKLNNQVFQADKDHDDDLDLNWPFSETGINYYHKLADGKYGKCFIAYMDGKAVGYAALCLKNFGYRKSKYVEIENIGVDPEHRSQGIGKLLMEKAVEWAKEQQATKLYVVAFWENKRAIKFYKQHGFYETGLEMDRRL